MIWITLGSIASLYITIPILINFFPRLISYVVFLNGLCPPNKITKLNDPENAYQLDQGVKNVYIDSPHGGKIGVWRMSPLWAENMQVNSKTSSADSDSDLTPTRVILYCHGNSYHRGFGHRLKLYSLLRNHGFWVVTFDYRGYADSTGKVTETGAVEDILAVYNYIDRLFPDADNILVWGHSLGTSLASNAVKEMKSRVLNQMPIGLILESPFDSVEGILEQYPVSKAFLKIYPRWMKSLIMKALKVTNLCLDTKKYLREVSCNVMILHAEDDSKVHYKLGRALFEQMIEICRSGAEICPRAIKFVKFHEKHQLGHSGIYSHADLLVLVEQFLKDASSVVRERFVDIEL